MIGIMKRIDIVSVKGGVGKSFIAFFIAKTLSEDHTVLLFDKDLSSTISRMYNIKNCLLSFLIEESFSDYFRKINNLTVLNLGCNKKINSIDSAKIAEVYNYFNDYEFMIVDNPPIPSDMCLDKELEAYYAYLNGKKITHNLIPVLPPNQILLDESVAFLKLFKQYIKDFALMHGNEAKINIIATIINMYNPLVKLDLTEARSLTDKIIKIPFIKEAVYTPFNSLPKPKEIDQLLEYVLQVRD